MPTIIAMQRVGDEVHVTIALPADGIAPRGKGTRKTTVLDNLRKALKGVGTNDGNGAGNGKIKSARV
jgi:hypothetical protein